MYTCLYNLLVLLDAVGGKSKQVSQLEEEVLSLRHHLSVLQKDAGKSKTCEQVSVIVSFFNPCHAE